MCTAGPAAVVGQAGWSGAAGSSRRAGLRGGVYLCLWEHDLGSELEWNNRAGRLSSATLLCEPSLMFVHSDMNIAACKASWHSWH